MPNDTQHPQAASTIDPALLDYIDKTVSAKLDEQFGAISGQLKTTNRATIVVFSNDLDKLFAAFAIATGAAAAQMQVSMFFTFWGLTALKKKTVLKGKSITEKLMTLFLPSGPADAKPSKMNMLGVGQAFLKHVMKKKNVSDLPDLITLASQLGVRMVACQTSMDIMGIRKEELIEGLDFGGVATYIADAADSKITLFI